MSNDQLRYVWRLPVVLTALATAAIGPPLAAEEPSPERSAVDLMTPEADQAIAKGLEYLAKRQHDDGSFGSGTYHGNVAVTALSGMAFMAGGSLPNRGPHGATVAQALDYILASTQESGFIVHAPSATHGPMYGHGFATLFLAESYGSSHWPEHRDKLVKAVGLIVNTQNQEGGWRYQPQRLDADISVTICQVMALRAARNAGIHVPKETIDRCVEYVKRCQNPDGGFMYMAQGGESAFARSAAGVVALQSAGIYTGQEIDKGIGYLRQFVPRPGVTRHEPYYFYGHYYAVQAFWHRGGEPWQQWFPAIRDELIARQRDDGSWTDPISTEFATAVAALILQVPDNYLHIFER